MSNNLACSPQPLKLEPSHALKTVFGFEEFRSLQQKAIDSILRKESLLVVMPTGGGKSLCYQIPSICLNGLGVVVSPLIALMNDQVRSLKDYGINAEAIHSSVSDVERKRIFRSLRAGELDMLYVSPERLISANLIEYLKEFEIGLFAVDEAHCVSQWGHDFRPEYMQLATIAEHFPEVPRIALTATADQRTREDILETLRISKDKVFIGGFDRPNINYTIASRKSPKKQLVDFIKSNHPQDSGIVYCISRKKVEETAAQLCDEGIEALPYHAGLPSHIRAANQQRFIDEEKVVVVATIAFGMGIDKPNVRFVAHIDLPKSIESYYQETGRAGRDGLPANAWMIYGMSDVANQYWFIDSSDAPQSQKLIEKRKIQSLIALCETTSCRRQVLLKYFGDDSEPCGNCDTCLNPVKSYDGTEYAQMALSCIYRVQQKFGTHHVIDVLLGAKSEKVLRFNHDSLSTYGVGARLSRIQWQSIMRQLIAHGYIEVDHNSFSTLKLTQSAKELLTGKKSISFREDHIKVKKLSSSHRGTSTQKTKDNSIHSLSSEGKFLAEKLRKFRKEAAKRRKIAPYMVFSDRSLLDLVALQPQNLEQLRNVFGFGEYKVQHYGGEILEVINHSSF